MGVLALIATDILLRMTQKTERCGLWAVQVLGTQLHQSHSAEAADYLDVAHCTPIPFTQERTGLKRLRKQVQLKEFAMCGESLPKPQRTSKAKKLITAEGGLADPPLQTLMPESEAGNEFGPPPPDTTPGPQREHSCSIVHERVWLI